MKAIGEMKLPTTTPQATRKEHIDCQIKLDKKQIKRILHNNKRNQWKNRWVNSATGRTVHSIIKDVNTKRCLSNFWINQAITEHGAFPAYQKRFANRTDKCSCDIHKKAIGTAHHIIKEFEAFCISFPVAKL